MADKQIRTIRWEDGRHAERHVTDWHPTDDGTEQRVEELYLEPERQLNLKKKVIEKRKPVVVHRTTQTIEGDQIVDQVVEDREPDKLQIVQHIGLANPPVATVPQDDLAAQVKELVGVLKDNQQPRRMSRMEMEPPLQAQPDTKAIMLINLALSLVIVGLMSAIGIVAVFG